MTPAGLDSSLRQALLKDLMSLFDRVEVEIAEGALPSAGANPCAACFTCCTARGLTSHKVTDIEYALVGERVSPRAAEQLRQYIGRDRDAQGQLLHEVCPSYDLERQGCSIYRYRPFACRVFGHLLPEGSSLPPGCFYHGRARGFASKDYLLRVPGAPELRRLSREFMFLAPPQPAHFTEEGAALPTAPVADLSVLRPDDPLDKALLLQLEGRLEEALAALVEARGQAASPSVFLDHSLATLLTRMELHEPALAVYTSLLKRLPQRADWHYYAGYHALFSRHRELARQHFLACVQALPDHSLALGFLGYLDLQDGNWEEAEPYFARALDADPHNPYLHLRLGRILQRRGEPDARLHLERAAQHSATREDAEKALQEL